MSYFDKYDGSCPYAHLKVYGVAMAPYGDIDKLLIQNFLKSLTEAALTWFTNFDISIIKKGWTWLMSSLSNVSFTQK